MTKFRVFQDKRKKWRWQLLARNKKIIADSGQGYASKGNVIRAIKRVKDVVVTSIIIVA